MTRGPIAEDRILNPNVLPSPARDLRRLPRPLVRPRADAQTLVSLQRVVLGFGLAAMVGIPLGVLCGCFRRISAFFAPLMIVGRNIPVAAVIPLTLSLFGIGEFQKIMFIFIACVAFVVMDTATAVADVSGRYIDTAYTLGPAAGRSSLKVLVPLAMPSIFNSLAAAVRPGLRLHHAGRGITFGGVGRAGEHHQPRPERAATRPISCWC